MLYAAHEAELNAPTEDGATVRAYLESRAATGKQDAIDKLAGPERPIALEYLWERFQTLDAMRAEGMNGRAPLTADAIDAANRLFQWHLTPLEVDGLCRLDGATRHPESMRSPSEAVERAPSAWPTRAT